MAWAPNAACTRSELGLGCFLYLAQSVARDHGLTFGTGANVFDLDSHKLLDVLLDVSITFHLHYTSPIRELTST